jgi:hypothetical protein
MRIAVVDGQGGGIGKSIIERMRKDLGSEVEIIALGTNALATSGMIRAGADKGATGENAIIYNSGRVDLIIGPIAIIIQNSLLGEISKDIASAISQSRALKMLIPVNKCGVFVIGTGGYNLSRMLDETIQKIKEVINDKS